MLIKAGLHVPLIPFVELAGSVGAMLFWHNAPIAVKVGVIWVVIVTSNVADAAHCPASGVKV